MHGNFLKTMESALCRIVFYQKLNSGLLQFHDISTIFGCIGHGKNALLWKCYSLFLKWLPWSQLVPQIVVL